MCELWAAECIVARDAFCMAATYMNILLSHKPARKRAVWAAFIPAEWKYRPLREVCVGEPITGPTQGEVPGIHLFFWLDFKEFTKTETKTQS